MSFDVCWYLSFASQIVDVDVRARTDIPYQNFCQICYTELLQANASQLLRTSIEMYGTYTTKISYSVYISLTNECIDSVRLDLTCHMLQLQLDM